MKVCSIKQRTGVLEISFLRNSTYESACSFFDAVLGIAEQVNGKAAWWGASDEHAVIHIYERTEM